MNSVEQQNVEYGFSLKEPQEGTMKKQLLKSALIAVAGVGLMAGSAMATFTEVGADYWTISEQINYNGVFEIELESADWESDFGIYFTNNTQTSITNTLEIFDATDEEDIERTLKFTKLGSSSYQVDVTERVGLNVVVLDSILTDSDIFGFYFEVLNVPNTYYTDSLFNTTDVGVDHIKTYYDDFNSEAVIAFEDMAQGSWTGTEPDFNDMQIFAHDVKPVPEPATMLLFGAGLLGLAAAARTRKNS